MKLIVVSGLSDEKLRSKLLPISNLEEVEVIYLIRRRPLIMPKVVSIIPPSLFLKFLPLAEFYRLLSLMYLSLVKKPHVIISIYFLPHGVYASIAGIMFGKRTIHVLTGSDLPKVVEFKPWIYLLKKASNIAVRGKRSLETLSSRGIPRNALFSPPNVFDLNTFTMKEENRFIPSKKPYDLIYIGNLIPLKRLDLLLEVIAKVREKLPGIRVAILGSGHERGKLEALANRLQLNENVDFLGYCPPATVAAYLHQSRAFIMTSQVEGLPMAMIEALTSGTPVIVPNVGDITDVAIHQVNALIVDPPTIEGFTLSIVTLLTDQSLYSYLVEGALASREKFIKEYSIYCSMELWSEVLSKN